MSNNIPSSQSRMQTVTSAPDPGSLVDRVPGLDVFGIQIPNEIVWFEVALE